MESWLHWGWPSNPNLGILALLAALAITAQQYPFVLGPQHKANAAIGCYFAALLLFGPSTALALTAGSQLVGGMLLHLRHNPRTGKPRRGLPEVVFNTAQLTLAIGLAGVVAHAGPPLSRFAPGSLTVVGWAVPAAAIVAALANSWLVALMVGIRQQRTPFQVWRRGQPDATVETAVVLGLGVVVATVAIVDPWM
ncbi:MAG TPA: hypothetical protein VGP33_04165, partial [Chloroflexota bacterium]|nr:hypothetical protein [Chloroflexota bacterium]